jgi:hypothetical protein
MIWPLACTSYLPQYAYGRVWSAEQLNLCHAVIDRVVATSMSLLPQ